MSLGTPRRDTALAAAGLLLGALACAGPAWDADRLVAREPQLGADGARHLRAATPYLLPSKGALIFFLCRWTTEAPIPVVLPPDADEAEQRALAAALAAWEDAGLGVRFVSVAPEEASLRIELAPGPVPTAAGTGAGNTVSDCLLGGPEASTSERLPAELVSASVRLARTTPVLGKPEPRPVTPQELAGAAVHELGHALGFQGHVWGGERALSASPDTIRRLGANVLAGEPFADAHLAALYAVPSGTVLARVAVEPWRTELADRLLGIARANAWRGPFVRVGDRAARIFWRDLHEQEYGVQILDVARIVRHPERMLLIAEPRARHALSR